MKNTNFNIGDWIMIKEEILEYYIKEGIVERGELSPLAREIKGIREGNINTIIVEIKSFNHKVEKNHYRLATENEIKKALLKEMFIK